MTHGFDAREHEPGTREELRVMLEAAGLGPRQTAVWLDSPTALLSGLVPSVAITEAATAARARYAARRLVARLGDPVPHPDVEMTAVRLLQPGTRRVGLSFAWPGGTAVRHMDLAPYLWGRGFTRVREDLDTFARLRVEAGKLRWPGGLELPPVLLFRESSSAETSAWHCDGD